MIFFVLFYLPIVFSGWSVYDHHIYKDNIKFDFKGVNWYGFDTKARCLEGLMDNNLDFYFEKLKHYKFNSIRLPVSLELILYDKEVVSNDLVSKEPRLFNKTPLEMVHGFFDAILPYEINVLIDIHRLRYGVSNPLWYIPNNHNYTEDLLIDGFNVIISKFKNYPIFLGIDLYNEPHYIADYGSENKTTDWKLFIEKSLQNFDLLFSNDLFLVFINGIDWGKNMSQFGNNLPIIPPSFSNQIIYSPHLYGPALTYFASLEKEYLYSVWDSLFGYLNDTVSIFIGEWGGKMSGRDKTWQDIFAQYLIYKNIRNNFYWALNPYSNDVGGLMASWFEFDEDKLILLDHVQQTPS
jgi:endoglucanase